MAIRKANRMRGPLLDVSACKVWFSCECRGRPVLAVIPEDLLQRLTPGEPGMPVDSLQTFDRHARLLCELVHSAFDGCEPLRLDQCEWIAALIRYARQREVV